MSGTRGVRRQAGWAKTEQQPGKYDWRWLDEVVDDTRAQGTLPWVQISYGNPAYPEGSDGVCLLLVNDAAYHQPRPDPGAYTVILSGGSGTVLAEIYAP